MTEIIHASEEGKKKVKAAKWKKAISKFKRALVPEHEPGKLTDAIVDSVRVKIVHPNKEKGDHHLQEIAQGKHIFGSNEYKMLRMSPEELKTCQLSYDKSKEVLLDYIGKPATTIGKESKGMKDTQAFVMAKDGTLYIASHAGAYDKKNLTLTHASFLEGRPVETAGMIGIQSNGKIGYISDNSGHYQPEAIDMYRGIKQIQSLMPGVLDKDCLIDLYGKERMFVSDFIKVMEEKDQTLSSSPPKTLYEVLREQRVQKIKGTVTTNDLPQFAPQVTINNNFKNPPVPKPHNLPKATLAETDSVLSEQKTSLMKNPTFPPVPKPRKTILKPVDDLQPPKVTIPKKALEEVDNLSLLSPPKVTIAGNTRPSKLFKPSRER